jgi:hypothetical protein
VMHAGAEPSSTTQDLSRSLGSKERGIQHSSTDQCHPLKSNRHASSEVEDLSAELVPWEIGKIRSTNLDSHVHKIQLSVCQ